MRFSLLSLSFIISLSAAQTTSVCAALPVLDDCLQSTEAVADTCATTDYQCLCQEWEVVVVCFNQCPNDPRYTGILASQQAYCEAASEYDTTTTTAISRSVSGSAASTTGSSGATTATTTSNTAAVASSTRSGTATATATATKNAGMRLVPGGMMAAVGFAGALL